MPLRLLLFLSLGFTSALIQASTFTVIHTNDSGPGSLRQAILNANASAGPHVIQFDIPGTGVQTIAPLNVLPAISNSVTIDGYTQPGSAANALDMGNNAALLIRLDGVRLTNGNPAGLDFYSSGNTVRGLILIRFYDGLVFHGSSGSVVAGNWIGYDADHLAPGNSHAGVYFTSVAFERSGGNTVGGTAPASRNVISGNGTGLFIWPGAVGGNTIHGNYIGTDASGTMPRGNRVGVFLQATTNNLVGGTTPGSRNVVSGNSAGGVSVLGAFGNTIQGNYIGTDAFGSSPLGNGFYGIKIQDFGNNTVGGSAAGAGNLVSGNDGPGIFLLGGTNILVQGNLVGSAANGSLQISNRSEGIYVQGTTRSLIGGPFSGEGNVVRFNGSTGVRIFGGDKVSVRGNRISDNAGLGIDLAFAGVLANDIGDGDTGSNGQQNYPELWSAFTSPSATLVYGTLSSATNAAYVLDFYSSPAGDPSTFGEGAIFLGTHILMTGPNGTVDFEILLPAESTIGHIISATATDTNQSTSEFSRGVAVTAARTDVSMTIVRTGGVSLLEWPSAATGFKLEYTPQLLPPVQWQELVEGIENNGITKSYLVTNVAGATNRFYRLRKP